MDGPLEQFDINTLVPIQLGSVDASLTNSGLYMILTVIAVTLFLTLSIRRRGMVPGRWQSLAELSYEFVAGMLRDNVGPEGTHHRCDVGKCLVVCCLGWGEDPGRTDKHRRVGSLDALLLASCHWMTGDKAPMVDLVNDRALDRADVGHDPAGEAETLLHRRHNLEGRDSDEGDLGLGIDAFSFASRGCQRLIHPVGVDVGTRHVPPAFDERLADAGSYHAKPYDVGTSLLRHRRDRRADAAHRGDRHGPLAVALRQLTRASSREHTA